MTLDANELHNVVWGRNVPPMPGCIPNSLNTMRVELGPRAFGSLMDEWIEWSFAMGKRLPRVRAGQQRLELAS